MQEWIKALRNIIIENLSKNRFPLPADRSICGRWAEGLREGGARILYTSCMYQLAPLIDKSVDLLERVGASEGGLRAKLAALGARAFGGLVLRPSEDELGRAERILKNIATMLTNAGVQFGVLRDEPYSGALLYELGFERDFADYAAGVYEYLKSNGVEEVITVDPHTHYILSEIYPKFIKEFNIKVISYMDLIKPKNAAFRGKVVVHDSCLYARYLGKYDSYRRILDSVGVERVENSYITGRAYSGCCGGPIESVKPDVAREVAKIRVSQLAKLSDTVMTVCPICYVNLSKASRGAVRIFDLAEVVS
ncbi:MAG: (Fe-S)-binding protein [Thermoproteus sp.]|nr:(Fe-S)-binding protein [Thermoproteus sp.]MBP1449023.1 (Fe-S)-binding protein [Thermoproteus sp.]